MTRSLDTLRIDKGTTGAEPAKKKPLRLLLTGTAIFIAGVLTIYFYTQKRSINVETATVTLVYPSQGVTLLNASGYVVAQRKAAVAAKITGRLEWLGVEEGSRVKAGEVVARLENLDLKAAVDQARSHTHAAFSTVEQAKAEQTDATGAFERQRVLLKQGIVAKADFDAAEARFRRAVAAVNGATAALRVSEASLRSAEIALEYSFIRAPFDAVVLTKNADIGDIITPLGAAANAKAAVVTIADLGSLEVEADVSESNLAQVTKGQPCEVSLDALPGSRFRAVVHTIVPTADRSKASVMVKVRFIDQDRRILPEMSAKVAFLSRQMLQEEQQPRVAVHAAAIIGNDKSARVYRIVDGIARVATVTTGARYGDLLETRGVKPGEKLILKPLGSIKDGSRVTVQEK